MELFLSSLALAPCLAESWLCPFVPSMALAGLLGGVLAATAPSHSGVVQPEWPKQNHPQLHYQPHDSRQVVLSDAGESIEHRRQALQQQQPNRPGGLDPKASHSSMRSEHSGDTSRSNHPSPPPTLNDPDSHGSYDRNIPPSPHPPPPPGPAPPPSPPPVVIGYYAGLEINITGDDRTDAHNIALVDSLLILQDYWFPIVTSIVALALFIGHDVAVNSYTHATKGGKGGKAGGAAAQNAANGPSSLMTVFLACFSAETREMLNVGCVACCYMLCAFSYLTFNKLVLLSIPLPCLVAAIQMGATCLLLLIVNGAVSACFQSRTSRMIRASTAECAEGCVRASLRSVGLIDKDDGGESGGSDEGGAGEGGADAAGQGGSGKRGKSVGWTNRGILHPQASYGIACCGMRKWVGIRVGSMRDVQRWIRASCLYAGTTLFLILALKDSTVSALVVWRQIAPLPTMIAERLLTNAVYRTSCSSIFGLLCIVIGILCYSASDYQFSWLGTLFAVLSTVLMVWEVRRQQRRLDSTGLPTARSLVSPSPSPPPPPPLPPSTHPPSAPICLPSAHF